MYTAVAPHPTAALPPLRTDDVFAVGVGRVDGWDADDLESDDVSSRCLAPPPVADARPRTIHLVGADSVRPATPTIGSDLERIRLEHRARRLEHMHTILSTRVRVDHEAGRRGPALSRVLDDFTTELVQVRGRLAVLVMPL